MTLFRGSAEREELLALRSRVARLEEQVARLEAALTEHEAGHPSPPLPDPSAAASVAPVLELAPQPEDQPDEQPEEPSYAEARALAAEGSKIHAIQLVIEQSGMSLKAAKDLVDSW